jgi:hypothetical protein
MRQDKLKLLGIRKILWPVKDVDLQARPGPTRALFGFLPRTREASQDLADFLKRVQLFEDLEVGHLKRMARLVHERSYRDGEYIFEQGKPGAAMFVLRMGCVDILRQGPTGEEMLLATLEPVLVLLESSRLAEIAFRQALALAKTANAEMSKGKAKGDRCQF